MKLTRRNLLKGATASAVGMAIPHASMAADAIKVGSIIDTSGIFDLYGKPMDKAVTLAIEEINASGGLLGRQLEKVAYDTQSDMALYTCLLYTSPSPRDATLSRMPSSA